MSDNERRIITGAASGDQTPLVSEPRTGFHTAFQTPGTPKPPTSLVLSPGAGAGEVWIVADWQAGEANSAGQVTQWGIEILKDGDSLPSSYPINADQEPPHRIRNLQPNTGYTITVRAITAAGGSSTPLSAHTTTGYDTTVPATLSGFAGGAGYKDVTLTWTALGTTLAPFTGKYLVESATNSGFTANHVTYDNADSNVTNIGNLTTGTQYWFRVRARSASGVDGATSSVLTFTPGLASALPTDGIVPTTTTSAPTVVGGPGYLFAKWTPITNDDVVTYEVHVSTSSGFTPGAGTKVGEISATEFFVKLAGGGGALAYATNYYVKIYPKDGDGYTSAGPSAQTGPTTLVQVNTADIAVNAITAVSGIIQDLSASVINTGTFNAALASVINLNASALTAGNISASVGYLGNLTAGQITTGTLNASAVSIINLNASNITTGNLNFARLQGGTLGAFLIELASGGTIRNTGFSSGTAGWQIDGAGNAEFNNIVVRGIYRSGVSGLRVEIASVGVNELSFYTGTTSVTPGDGLETSRGFLQVSSGGGLSLQSPTMSGYNPAEILMLGDVLSLDVNGTGLTVTPTGVNMFKPVDMHGQIFYGAAVNASGVVATGQVEAQVLNQTAWNSYSFLATATAGGGTRAGIGAWADTQAIGWRLDTASTYDPGWQSVDWSGTAYSNIYAADMRANNYLNHSSETTKFDIVSLKDLDVDIVEQMLALDPVRFKRRALLISGAVMPAGPEADRIERYAHFGLIAERVGSAVPEAAGWAGDDDGRVPDSVDYAAIGAGTLYLAQAGYRLAEQMRTRVEQLERRLDALVA